MAASSFRSKLHFDNAILRNLPVEAKCQNRVTAKVAGACYSRVPIQPLDGTPKLVAASASAWNLLSNNTSTKESVRQDLEEYIPYFAGNELLPGSEPAAHCYAGHQFGHFSGQLGDGAAMFLGQVKTPKGPNELQLKGSGLTPYSRQADGRKVLRSSLREFLCSEHMHALGVPTTRSASVITSSDSFITRDPFYNGCIKSEQAAVITRIASTFLRFGSFEIFKATDAVTGRAGPSVDVPNAFEMLQSMVNYTRETYFTSATSTDEMFCEIASKTATMVAKWQAIGFVHGVLNTDNMSIIGLTIDYGPFGFLEHFDPSWICNASDEQGRYTYKTQRDICRWNLKILAEQWRDLLDGNVESMLQTSYDEVYIREYKAMEKAKLGLDNDCDLISEWWQTLESTAADFTRSFRLLSRVKTTTEDLTDLVNELVSLSATLGQLKEQFECRIIPEHYLEQFEQVVENFKGEQDTTSVLRGIAAQVGIPPGILISEMTKRKRWKEMVADDNSSMASEEALRNRHRIAWTKFLSAYQVQMKAQFEASSTTNLKEWEANRQTQMDSVNPAVILRNHVAQAAIDAAEAGDTDLVDLILDVLQNPFVDDSRLEERLKAPLPPNQKPLVVTCSS